MFFDVILVTPVFSYTDLKRLAAIQGMRCVNKIPKQVLPCRANLSLSFSGKTCCELHHSTLFVSSFAVVVRIMEAVATELSADTWDHISENASVEGTTSVMGSHVLAT